MKILGLERDHGACNHYRVVQPLYKLREHFMEDVLTIHGQNISDINFVVDKIVEAEIIMFQRAADDKWFEFIKTAQKHGKIIVLDYDDNPFKTSPLNPAYKWDGTSQVKYMWPDGREEMLWEHGKNGFDIEKNIMRRDYFKAAFKKADMVSTTTPILQTEFKKINDNTLVLPNLIDFDLYPQVDMVKKEIRIGWQGGVSHYEDLYMIAPAVKKILNKYDNVKFIYFGDYRFGSLFKDIPENKFEFHSWVQFVAYPYKFATLNIDIGLCPVVDNEFNRNKSAIKYFENSVMKIATIASNIPPYSDVIINGRDGILVNEDGWYDAMEELINDKIKHNALADNAYDNIYENHNADKKAYLWRDAFSNLLKKDVAELVGA